MFRALKYHRERRSLEVFQSRVMRLYEKDMREAKDKKAGWEAIEKIEQNQHFEWNLLEGEIQQLESNYLLHQARKLSVPAPERKDKTMWEQSSTTNLWQLTTKGRSTIRSAIRSENKERFESLRLWLPALAAGLSALAAWVAVLRK